MKENLGRKNEVKLKMTNLFFIRIILSEIKFELKPIDEKPPRKYRKCSKYDPIPDAFVEDTESLVEVAIEEKDANYLRNQLNKGSK